MSAVIRAAFASLQTREPAKATFRSIYIPLALGLVSCSHGNHGPKTFEIQVRGNVHDIAFDAMAGSVTALQRGCVKDIRVYAIDNDGAVPSAADDQEAVRQGFRWEATGGSNECLGSLPRRYGDSGAGRVRVTSKPLQLGSSYGVGIKLVGDVLGSARFQVMADGTLRAIPLKEALQRDHSR